MMKKAFRTMVCGAMMMASMLTMTSCLSMIEWILGEDDNPTEVLTNLGAALEEGALITIDYTIDGVKYTSTFKKVGDEYIKQSTTPAAARALTRGVEEAFEVNLILLGYVDDDEVRVEVPNDNVGGEKGDLLNFEISKDGETKVDASINIETNVMTTNFATEGSAVQSVQVNSQEARLVNTETEYAGVQLDETGDEGDKKLGGIPFSEGESWIDMAGKQENNGGQYLQIDEDGNKVYFSANGYTGYLVDINKTPVRPKDKVRKQTFVLKNSGEITYKEHSWDATNHKVVSSNKTIGKYQLVTDSKRGVTWKGGSYVVNKNTTIKGKIICKGVITLFLCDGCRLKANTFSGKKGKSITIYGNGSGRLISRNIVQFKDFVIQGGVVEATGNGCEKINFTMYGGKFSAKNSGNAMNTGDGKSMTIYDGEVEVTSTNKNAIVVGDDANLGTLTVYGGTVKANAPNGQALKGKFAAGNGCAIGFFATDDLNNWGEALFSEVNTTTKKYFKAEVETSLVTNN